MADAGIDPDIKRIVAPRQGGRQTDRRSHFGISELVPDVCAALFNQQAYLPNPIGVQNRLSTLIENWKGHTPASLPGDTPVRARLDRAIDPIPTPWRHPGNLVDRFECCALD